jgi:hypothetical protein
MTDTITQPYSLSISIDSNRAKAVIQLGGGNYEFRASAGVMLDPYYDPLGEFVQQNILCVHASLPGFRAYYRPDQASSREEWVFEFGDCWITPVPPNLAAYTAEITRRDGSVISISAPKGHYWHARWRWYSSPRRVRRTAKQLWDQDLIPCFDVAGLATGSLINVSAYTPMATCGMPADQGQTGGYWGLGIQTGPQTQYLVRGAAEASFRNVGEAAASYQSHVRDVRTGAPIDIWHDYPQANMYSANTGSPFFSRGTQVNRTDQGHMPSAAYLPFLLTGDPYYLEECQFWANHNRLTLPGNGSRYMVMGRYLAWPLRAEYECFLATPENVPSWLLPKSYWQHWLDVCRGFVTDRMANTIDPYYYVFHTIPDSGQTTTTDPSKSGDHVWQQNMLDLVASWIACLRDEWVEPAEWLIRSSIDRASATSGWCRARGSPYHMRLQNVSVLAEAMTTSSTSFRLQYSQLGFKSGITVKIDSESFVLRDSSDGLTWTFAPRTSPAAHSVNREVWGAKCTSWAEARELNIATYGWGADVADNDHIAPSATDLTYQSYQRAALAQALRAGLEAPGLLDAAKWLDDEMRRLISSRQTPPIGDNWCAVPLIKSRRHRPRRSDRTDPQLHPELLDLAAEFRGVES